LKNIENAVPVENTAFAMVLVTGIEPVRGCPHGILSPVAVFAKPLQLLALQGYLTRI